MVTKWETNEENEEEGEFVLLPRGTKEDDMNVGLLLDMLGSKERMNNIPVTRSLSTRRIKRVSSSSVAPSHHQ